MTPNTEDNNVFAVLRCADLRRTALHIVCVSDSLRTHLILLSPDNESAPQRPLQYP